MHRSAAISLLPDPSSIHDPAKAGQEPAPPHGESSAVRAISANGTATIAGGSGEGVELEPRSSSGGAGEAAKVSTSAAGQTSSAAAAAPAAGSSAGAGTGASANGEGREHAQGSMLAHLLKEFHPEFIGASFFCVRVHVFGLTISQVHALLDKCWDCESP